MWKIEQRIIGPDTPPFLIAEMSGNHNQSLERALEIVDAAAKAGAHAIKLQTYTADTMTLDATDGEFSIRDPKSLWNGESLYQLYKQAYTPWEWHEPIMKRAKEKGLICFSSPFDTTAVDFLERLGVPAYKIASFEITDIPLIRRVARTGKPVIVSTGMATVEEISKAVSTIKDEGNETIALLKCTSTYPASPENTNIRTIPHLQQMFGCIVGLSDHTMGTGVSVASVAFGACIIEKHFTLNRADGGVDSAFSLEPAEFSQLNTECRRAWESLGKIHYGPTESEKASLKFRRSLYIVADIRRGESLTKENIRCIRPGLGLAPQYMDIVLGKKASRDLKRGDALQWDHIN